MSQQQNRQRFKSAAVLLILALAAAGGYLAAWIAWSKTDEEKICSVVINEVMSSNSMYAPCPEGRYTDWVELYNYGSETVSLEGCWLTDKESEPARYSLSGISIEPGEYAAVYLSPLLSDSDACRAAPFGLSSAGETLFLLTEDGIEIDRMEVPALRENISYGRNEEGLNVFWLTPSFCAANSGSCASSANALAYTVCKVQISEYMLKNSMGIRDCDGEYSNWIELCNFGEEEIVLDGFSLSPKESGFAQWEFPQGTKIGAGEYLLVFCSGKNKVSEGEIHTDFTIGRNSDYLGLRTNEGFLAQELFLEYGGENISACSDGEGGYVHSEYATPGEENRLSEAAKTPKMDKGIIINEVCAVSGEGLDVTSDYIELYNRSDNEISLEGYTLGNDIGEPFFTFPAVTLKAGGYVLVYCDGKNAADPKKTLHADTKLSAGGEDIYLTDGSGDVCDYFASGKQRAGITSGRLDGDTSLRWFFTSATPSGANSAGYTGFAKQPEASAHGGFVKKGTKITLTCAEGAYITYTTDGSTPTRDSKKYSSPITINRNTVLKFRAYSDGLISGDVVTETYFVAEKHTIPVVSLTGNPKNLSDKQTGMVYDENNREEYPCHVEFFDENGVKAVEFDAGVALFGYDSRQYLQKGLRLRLREKYGENEVSYPFFGDRTVDTFSSLLLRPGGEDQVCSKLRDDFIPLAIKGMNLDYQESRAAALYINGKYWGLYFIRERLDANYIESKYGIDKDKVDIIKANRQVVTGSGAQYTALVDYINSHDMRNDEEYAYAAEQIDIDSLCNFWIVETYFCNLDIGNIKCFRERTTGKWRWMIYDMDWAMWKSTWDTNMIETKLLTTGYLPNIQNNKIMRNMLKNRQFRDRFITLYCYHIENTFNTERLTGLFNGLTEYVQPELKRQYKELKYLKQEQLDRHWKYIRHFFAMKPKLAYSQLRSAFDLTEAQLESYKAAAAELEL